MQHLNPPVLVADIGGTHIRMALAETYAEEGKRFIKLHDISVKRCRDYEDPVQAISDYPEIKEASRDIMCLAVAAPVNSGRAHLTNHHWDFDQKIMQNAFGVNQVRIINDFHAQALSIPYLDKKDIERINEPSPDFNEEHLGTARLVIGPGTGLGTASLIPLAGNDGWKVMPGEGGHVNFSPRTFSDQQLVNFLYHRKNMSRISAEDLLSGRGIERLYQAHLWFDHETEAYLKDKEIIQKALEEKDPLCKKALHHFCEILGNVAGNAALTVGARAGVYITGGLIPRFPDIFRQSRFQQAFEDKGPVAGYMKAIPVHAVFAKQPGLIGAAASVL